MGVPQFIYQWCPVEDRGGGLWDSPSPGFLYLFTPPPPPSKNSCPEHIARKTRVLIITHQSIHQLRAQHTWIIPPIIQKSQSPTGPTTTTWPPNNSRSTYGPGWVSEGSVGPVLGDSQGLSAAGGGGRESCGRDLCLNPAVIHVVRVDRLGRG